MFIWDDAKSAGNKSKHGLAFDAIHDFDWETSIGIDRSRLVEDGEVRAAQIGWLYGKLYTVIFTRRADDIRIISLRRSNRQEEKIYGQKN